MIRINQQTGRQYQQGDIVQQQGQDTSLKSILVKVKQIRDLDKQLQLIAVDETSRQYVINFWKVDYKRDPNIYLDGATYKLAEIKENDVIEVLGYEYYYNNTLQLQNFGYQLSQQTFRLKSDFDTLYYYNRILSYINMLDDERLQKAVYNVISNIKEDFIQKPAANKHHHNYIGGLVQHTYEVVSIAYGITKLFKCDADIVLASAILHDVAKIYEYTDEGDYLDYGLMKGHIVGSAEMFKDSAEYYDVDQDTINQVEHCILSHHGKKEWGSPVEPQTIEANIVHNADLLSSRLNPLYNSNDKSKDYYLI